MVADQDSSLLHSSTEGYFTDLQDPFEAEEALSFCDLPIHSDSFKWDDDSSSKFDRSYSSEEEDNLFEFFSEDFTASTYPAKQDIIFCGKLIPYKEFPAPEKTQKFEINQKQKPTIKRNRFQWKSLSFNKLVKPSSKKTSQTQQMKESKALTLPISKNESCYSTEKCRNSIGNKVPSVLASSTKSRWYLFMFGVILPKFPTEMELRDIKLRQSKRFPSPMFSSSFEREMNIMGSDQKGRSGKRLWRLSRALGCRNQNVNDVVMAF